MSVLATAAEQLALANSPDSAPPSYVAEYEERILDALRVALDSVEPPDLEEHIIAAAEDAAEREAETAREAEIERALRA